MTTPAARKAKRYRQRIHQAPGESLLVDASEARAILTELADRMSYSAIARAIDSSHGYVTAIIRGHIKRISPDRHQAILRAGDYQPTDTSHVNPDGARRRLQALHAIGYSWQRIADELGGYSLGPLKHVVYGTTPVIEARHDKLIRDAYERLSMRLPEARNIQEQSGITRARNTARTRGWPPPLAYADIDHPTGNEARHVA